jgi:hypothetical protein
MRYMMLIHHDEAALAGLGGLLSPSLRQLQGGSS